MDLGRLVGSPLQFHLPSSPGNGPEQQTPVLSPLGHHEFHPAELVVTTSLFLPISDIATIRAETGSNFVSAFLAVQFFISAVIRPQNISGILPLQALWLYPHPLLSANTHGPFNRPPRQPQGSFQSRKWEPADSVLTAFQTH